MSNPLLGVYALVVLAAASWQAVRFARSAAPGSAKLWVVGLTAFVAGPMFPLPGRPYTPLALLAVVAGYAWVHLQILDHPDSVADDSGRPRQGL